MGGTAILDPPTWGGPFNLYNVTQTHSTFLKLYDNTFLDMPKGRHGHFWHYQWHRSKLCKFRILPHSKIFVIKKAKSVISGNLSKDIHVWATQFLNSS